MSIERITELFVDHDLLLDDVFYVREEGHRHKKDCYGLTDSQKTTFLSETVDNYLFKNILNRLYFYKYVKKEKGKETGASSVAKCTFMVIEYRYDDDDLGLVDPIVCNCPPDVVENDD